MSTTTITKNSGTLRFRQTIHIMHIAFKAGKNTPSNKIETENQI